MRDRFAPAGTVWVCAACGKTHADRYGIEGSGSRGWDESCMLNAVLCYSQKDGPLWTAVDAADHKPIASLGSHLQQCVSGAEDRKAKHASALRSLLMGRDQAAMRVYFVEAVGLSLIKIGKTRDVRSRVAAMQTDCPVPVLLLGWAPASAMSEGDLHKLFAAHRRAGEWFADHQEIRQLIDTHDAVEKCAPPAVASRCPTNGEGQ